jgi:hypothetical protein
LTYDQAFYHVTHGPWHTTGDDVQYRVEDAPGKVGRLFFQCSASDRDWINNFNFPAMPYKRMDFPWYVHSGFLKAWKSCRDTIADLVKDYEGLEIVGYSHGAALATFAHEDFLFTHGVYPRTITFGGPKVLWMPCPVKGRFDGMTRVLVRGDIVGMLPPLGYEHVGRQKLIGPWSWPSTKKHEPSAYRKYLEA